MHRLSPAVPTLAATLLALAGWLLGGWIAGWLRLDILDWLARLAGLMIALAAAEAAQARWFHHGQETRQ